MKWGFSSIFGYICSKCERTKPGKITNYNRICIENWHRIKMPNRTSLKAKPGRRQIIMSRTIEVDLTEDNNDEKQESRHIQIECGSINEGVQQVVNRFFTTPSTEQKRNVVKVECNSVPKKPTKMAQPNNPLKIKMMQIECETINEDVDKVIRNFFNTPPPAQPNRNLAKPERSTIFRMPTQPAKENVQKVPPKKSYLDERMKERLKFGKQEVPNEIKRKNPLQEGSLEDLKRMKFEKQEKVQKEIKRKSPFHEEFLEMPEPIKVEKPESP